MIDFIMVNIKSNIKARAITKITPALTRKLSKFVKNKANKMLADKNKVNPKKIYNLWNNMKTQKFRNN